MTGSPTQPAREIDPPTREAAAWFARLRADDVTGAHREAFEAWLEDARNRAAYARFEQFWSRTGSFAGAPEIAAVVETTSNEAKTPARIAPPTKPVNKRWGRYALAASVALLAVLVSYVWPTLNADAFYETKVGEQRTVALEDGSRITLNTDTRLRVAYTATARSIRLERGQAYFRVEGNPARPFDVHTDKGVVRALGTEFDVYTRDAETVVTLISGKVAVRQTEMKPGERAALTNESAVEVEPATVERSTAWLSGKLIFNDEPLERALSEANRYSTVKIAIADDALKTLRISGVFRTGEPAEFVHAITHYFPVTAERQSSGRYLLKEDLKESGGR